MNGIKYCAESIYLIHVWKTIIQVFGFCITSYNIFVEKSLLLFYFLKQIDNQGVLEVSMCSNSRHSFVQGKDLLWAAMRTSFTKAEQTPAHYCVGAHLCASGALQENKNFFPITAWNRKVSSTARFWKTDLCQSVTQTTWVILKCR